VRPTLRNLPRERVSKLTAGDGLSGRSQDAYDRFSEWVEVPLTVLAVLWIPVLVLPYAMTLSATVSGTFTAID
jgi:hypothetical protein